MKGTTIYTTKSITLNFPLKFLSFVRILSSLRFLFCANSSLCSVRSCTRHGRRKHKHRTEPPKQEQYPRRALSNRQILALSPHTIRLSNLPSLYCTDCLAHTRLSTRGRDDAQKSKPCLTVATPSASHPTSCHVPESHFHWIFTSYCSFRLLQPPCYFTRTHSTASASSSHRSIGKLPLKVNPLSCCVAAAPGLHRWSTSINCTICAFSSSQSWMVPGLRSGPNLVGFLSFPESPAKPTKTRPIPLDFNFP